MGDAIEDGVLLVNPVTGITRRLGLERDKEQVTPMSIEEVRTFLEACAQYRPEHYPLFLFALRTGTRMGELLGLQWGDIDWNGEFVEIKRSFKNGVFNKTKSGKGRRVDMSDQLHKALMRLYSQIKKEALAAGKGGEVVKYVFHRNSKPIAQTSLRNIFKGLLVKAGMRDMRFHDVRHTYASMLLSNGQSPVYVKEQMGHSSITITVDIYGHFIPSSNRDAVNKLDEMTAPSGTQSGTLETEKAVTN